jgi:hypothetical protein
MTYRVSRAPLPGTQYTVTNVFVDGELAYAVLGVITDEEAAERAQAFREGRAGLAAQRMHAVRIEGENE